MTVRFPMRKQVEDDSAVCISTERQFLTLGVSTGAEEYVFTIAKAEGISLLDFLESYLELNVNTYTGYKDDLQATLQAISEGVQRLRLYSDDVLVFDEELEGPRESGFAKISSFVHKHLTIILAAVGTFVLVTVVIVLLAVSHRRRKNMKGSVPATGLAEIGANLDGDAENAFTDMSVNSKRKDGYFSPRPVPISLPDLDREDSDTLRDGPATGLGFRGRCVDDV